MLPVLLRRRAAAAVLGCLGFLLIGWSGLVVPSLVRQVEAGFGQTDAGLGLFYLVNSIAYAAGSVGGGMVTERFGRRSVLVAAALLHGVGLLAQGSVASWDVFLLAGIPRGLGSGGIDGGVNGLILDLFPEARGRALNTVHLFFSLGALGAPFAFGVLAEAGVPWQLLVNGTGLVSLPLAALFAVTDLADGRRRPDRRPSGRTAAPAAPSRARPGLVAALPLAALSLAIGCYVASEMGVSSWLVRFLAAAPLAVATSALGLYWAGLTVGRLVSARFADRFDHLALAVAAAIVSSAALIGAVIAPSLPLAIVLFALVGFASGPIYPLIMAVGGERFPDRAAAVAGVLAGAAVAGSVVYPPLMGLLSVTVGLPAAMFGTAIIGFGCAGALLVAGRVAAPLRAGQVRAA
ncbi:MAG TPA: MFS transporter [Candidatus Limnocylindrales bacterium]